MLTCAPTLPTYAKSETILLQTSKFSRRPMDTISGDVIIEILHYIELGPNNNIGITSFNATNAKKSILSPGKLSSVKVRLGLVR